MSRPDFKLDDKTFCDRHHMNEVPCHQCEHPFGSFTITIPTFTDIKKTVVDAVHAAVDAVHKDVVEDHLKHNDGLLMESEQEKVGGYEPTQTEVLLQETQADPGTDGENEAQETEEPDSTSQEPPRAASPRIPRKGRPRKQEVSAPSPANENQDEGGVA